MAHNLFKMMWNMMTYMLWMNSFVHTAETAYDKKKQKCLTRHVQMVCSYNIPQDLQNILPLERWVISPQIPFTTILVMRWYGGHYKVNDPPVNVSATLDQIIEILPRMPSELQLHLVKLKCKLEYKTHSMYHMICRHYALVLSHGWKNTIPITQT